MAGSMYLILQNVSDHALVLRFVGLFALVYVIWGILHHAVHHSVTLRVVIEYIVVALLGVAIIIFILNGGI